MLTQKPQQIIPEVTALILAGGRGQRMNGEDKGLLEWQGKTFIAHIIERLQGQTINIVISCNRNLASYQRYGYACIADADPDFNGPLAGVS